ERGDSTSAGRRPACSRPAWGVNDSQIRSPASGASAASPRFAPDGRAPVRFAMNVLRRDPRQQFVERVPRLSRPQQETAVHASDFEFRALGEVELLGVGSGNGHGEAVAPLADLSVHDLTPRFYKV